MSTILDMVDIRKSFGAIKALDGVNFSLEKDEIHALVGENGAGKSTLMKVLSGSYSHGSYEGEIIIEGVKQFFKSPFDSKNAGIEMIYQEISMHPDLSVAENIFLGKIPSKWGFANHKKMIRESEKYLEMVGLKIPPTMIMRNLSTSQQQMVSIARALSSNPKILILDEPTSALTEAECEILHNNLLNFKKRGISCIYISHKLKEVYKLCDRVTTLRDGKTINTSVIKDEKLQTPIIIEEMIGRKLEVMYPKEIVEIGDEVLRIENLTIPSPVTKNKNIIDNISFYVRSGEILALAGLVGAGRSETVNAIFGSIRKTSGDIYINNVKVNINSPKDAIEAGIGLVTEDRKINGIIPEFSIKKNISIASLDDFGTKVWMNNKAEAEAANESMKSLSIKAPSVDSMILSLSGGNQQKVVLAKWLIKNLKVLILDEPTRGIDVGAKTQLYNIITELVKKGMAIIMISSELPELVAMCDRMYVLAEGKIQAELCDDNISENNMMKAATGY